MGANAHIYRRKLLLKWSVRTRLSAF